MNESTGVIVTGAAAHSMGVALVRLLSETYPKKLVIAVDRSPATELAALRNVYALTLDLNPLGSGLPFGMIFDSLLDHIRRMSKNLAGIESVILTAGVYDSGALVDLSTESCAGILGVNVCGNVEVLRSALVFNQSVNFCSRKRLAFMNIGSLHGLTVPSGRSLYAASKGFGLDLCSSLLRGREVLHAAYVAPGPIDTHMLHRNHWVSKERGSMKVFDYLAGGNGDLYRQVFVECCGDRMVDVATALSIDIADLRETMVRYEERRSQVRQSGHGILDVEAVVAYIANLMNQPLDGVHILMAPDSCFRAEVKSFDDVVRATR